MKSILRRASIAAALWAAACRTVDAWSIACDAVAPAACPPPLYADPNLVLVGQSPVAAYEPATQQKLWSKPLCETGTPAQLQRTGLRALGFVCVDQGKIVAFNTLDTVMGDPGTPNTTFPSWYTYNDVDPAAVALADPTTGMYCAFWESYACFFGNGTFGVLFGGSPGRVKVFPGKLVDLFDTYSTETGVSRPFPLAFSSTVPTGVDISLAVAFTVNTTVVVAYSPSYGVVVDILPSDSNTFTSHARLGNTSALSLATSASAVGVQPLAYALTASTIMLLIPGVEYDAVGVATNASVSGWKLPVQGQYGYSRAPVVDALFTTPLPIPQGPAGAWEAQCALEGGVVGCSLSATAHDEMRSQLTLIDAATGAVLQSAAPAALVPEHAGTAGPSAVVFSGTAAGSGAQQVASTAAFDAQSGGALLWAGGYTAIAPYTLAYDGTNGCSILKRVADGAVVCVNRTGGV